MGGVLALDLATALGWCAGWTKPVFGTERLPKDAGDGRRLMAFCDWLADRITDHRPALIVAEQPIAFRGIATIRTTLGLLAVTQLVACRRGIALHQIAPSSLKKHFTGSGVATKEQMIAEARRRGHDPGDDNQADALALWHWGRSLLPPAPDEPVEDMTAFYEQAWGLAREGRVGPEAFRPTKARAGS